MRTSSLNAVTLVKICEQCIYPLLILFLPQMVTGSFCLSFVLFVTGKKPTWRDTGIGPSGRGPHTDMSSRFSPDQRLFRPTLLWVPSVKGRRGFPLS